MRTFEHIAKRIAELEQSESELKVSEIVDAVLEEAIACGASDAHLEPTHGDLLLRYRIDGVLQPVAEISRRLAPNIIARLKVMSRLLTYRTDAPQEGRIDGKRFGREVDLRVSTFPTIHGEKAVVRIFDPVHRAFAISELGFAEDALDQVCAHLRRPQGVILLTGPSGSGKTTTIYAALRLLAETGEGVRHIVTVEDPVEYAIEGVTQTQVNPAAGFTFAAALRSLMRQDPEVIMIGEIRDPETAQIAIEAGLTGHLVISTIHSGAACGVFERLLDMGVEPYLITSSVTLAVGQRLVRRLCDVCKERTDEEEAYSGLKDRFSGPVWKPVGCERCFATGYRGRALLAEVLVVDERLKRLILERADLSALQTAAVESGMTPLLERGVRLAEQGVTTPAELRRVLVI